VTQLLDQHRQQQSDGGFGVGLGEVVIKLKAATALKNIF
jgi:hypothetical protein